MVAQKHGEQYQRGRGEREGQEHPEVVSTSLLGRSQTQLTRLTLGALTTQHPKTEISPVWGKESSFVSKCNYDNKVTVRYIKFRAKW